MRKIIIDTDPGHDDIWAILLALAHKQTLDILGFTPVGGNQTLEKVTNNLKKVLTYLKEDYSIALGYDAPLTRALEPQPLAHGESGMDGPILDESDMGHLNMHAIEFMKEMAIQHQKITLVGLGPLTNIAMFIKTYPHLKKHIECITFMGGSLHTGNIVPKAEFNLYADPEAAKIVFNSGIPLIMSPLEVCNEGIIYHNEMEIFHTDKTVSKLVYALLEFFCRYSKQRNIPYSPMFDVCPIMHLLYPNMFESEKYWMDVETSSGMTRGMSVADFREKEKWNVEVLMHVDQKRFMDIFTKAIMQLDEKYD